MLVILMKDQLLQPSTVCQGCLMANKSGLPRWQRGRLGCGRLVNDLVQNRGDRTTPEHTEQNLRNRDEILTEYECAMGFRLANIAE